jgi:trans-aconitate methyltransferase
MANTAYQLSGSAADLYEKFTVPTGAGPAARQLLSHVSLSEKDRILDAACGTGIVTRLLAELSIRVHSGEP